MFNNMKRRPPFSKGLAATGNNSLITIIHGTAGTCYNINGHCWPVGCPVAAVHPTLGPGQTASLPGAFDFTFSLLTCALPTGVRLERESGKSSDWMP